MRKKKLFPDLLTTTWRYINDECPWNTRPGNIDEFISSMQMRQEWTELHSKEPPSYWALVLTHSLMEDIVATVKGLKDEQHS